MTLVGRTSLFTLVERVLKKTKEQVVDAMIKMLIKVHSVLTITLENGCEFADHVRVSRAAGDPMCILLNPVQVGSGGQMRTPIEENDDFGPKSSTWRHSAAKKLKTGFYNKIDAQKVLGWANTLGSLYW